jgi:hypothetical protein
MVCSAIQLGGSLVSSIITSSFNKADAKKQIELEEELSKLSLDQQKELEKNLQNVQEEIERQKIVYQYLADKNKKNSLNLIKSKRKKLYIILGAGIFLLAGVLTLLSKKKHE